MTLKRLTILLATLMFLAGVGIAWLWQYAYTPQGRARVIIAQLKGDTTSLHGWLLQHHLVRPGFPDPPLMQSPTYPNGPIVVALHACQCVDPATNEMVKLDQVVLPVVIESLHDDNFAVQSMAIQACGKFRNPLAIQPLVKCLRDAMRPDPTGQRDMYDILNLCRDSLIEIGPEAFGQLREVSHDDRNMESRLAGALATKRGVAAIPQLIEMLEDTGCYGRCEAADELGKLKDKRATDALIGQLNSFNNDVQERVAKALGEIGDPKAISALLKTLNDQDNNESVRVSAAGALARMGRDDGLPFLLRELKSDNGSIQAEVAEALATNEIKGTYEPLLSLLSSKDFRARCHALEALGKLRDPRAIPAVRKLLNDPDNDVRRWAADAMKTLAAKPPPASQPGKT
jgi:HEAT repeat protein